MTVLNVSEHKPQKLSAMIWQTLNKKDSNHYQLIVTRLLSEANVNMSSFNTVK